MATDDKVIEAFWTALNQSGWTLDQQVEAAVEVHEVLTSAITAERDALREELAKVTIERDGAFDNAVHTIESLERELAEARAEIAELDMRRSDEAGSAHLLGVQQGREQLREEIAAKDAEIGLRQETIDELRSCSSAKDAGRRHSGPVVVEETGQPRDMDMAEEVGIVRAYYSRAKDKPKGVFVTKGRMLWLCQSWLELREEIAAKDRTEYHDALADVERERDALREELKEALAIDTKNHAYLVGNETQLKRELAEARAEIQRLKAPAV